MPGREHGLDRRGRRSLKRHLVDSTRGCRFTQRLHCNNSLIPVSFIVNVWLYNKVRVHQLHILRISPGDISLLLPALLEGLHLEFTPLAICLCCATRQPRPSDRQETYLVLTSPPVLLLIEAVIQLSVLLCIGPWSVCTRGKSPKSSLTCTTSAKDSGIPNSSQHRSGHTEF